jgi:hypothetical protein
MSYLIIKEIKSDNGKVLPVVLLDSQADVMEFDNREEADKMSAVLNINSDSGHNYRVKKIGEKE